MLIRPAIKQTVIEQQKFVEKYDKSQHSSEKTIL